MFFHYRLRLILLTILSGAVFSVAMAPSVSAQLIRANSALMTSPTSIPGLADEISSQILTKFKAEKLLADDFAFTLLDLSDPQMAVANYRADQPIYPASVVKLFYLSAAQNQLETRQLRDTPELRRAMRDMIVDSNNDATALVLDSITQTTGGPELLPEEFAAWTQKRNGVNRYFSGLGFEKINVNQKPWNEGPYGREKQFVSSPEGQRNKLTTSATARLLAQIGQQKWVSPVRSTQMLDLLKRNPLSPESADSQVVGFIGSAIRDIPGAQQWSKAGYTSATRHDVALVELPVSAQFPCGARFVLAIFTENHANNDKILPTLARLIIDKRFGKDARIVDAK